jgi:hypothetical protein
MLTMIHYHRNPVFVSGDLFIFHLDSREVAFEGEELWNMYLL